MIPRLIAALVAVTFAACAFADDDFRFTRERFDEMDRAIDAGRDIANADADAFAWGEGYMMRGYLEMYRATGDRDYLRRLVRVADAILATCPSESPRNRGKSHVWTIAGKYTVSKLVVKDRRGRDRILLRSIRYAYNDQTVVSVEPGPGPDEFSLTTSNEFWAKHGPAAATFERLSLDPASPRYFERVVNDARYIPRIGFTRSPEATEQPSYLIVATDLLRKQPAIGPAGRLAPIRGLKPTAMAAQPNTYYGYIGPVYNPMTRFASLVHQQADLQSEFGGAATRYVKAARDALSEWECCWRDGPGEGEGYYLLEPKGAPMWCDGIIAPFNYLGAAGQVWLGILDCTADPLARERASRMARLFRNACAEMPNGAYRFSYWAPLGARGWNKHQRLSLNTPEYGPNDVADDLSHGALELQFAIMCQQRGIVFTRSDMRRFAKTFTRNLWTGDPANLNRRVDGSGGPAEGNNVSGARWLDLCAFEPDIFDMNRAIWQANRYDRGTYGNLTGAYARLYRWQEELGR